jgi:ergothioneine biosynthesis protein EgtB
MQRATHRSAVVTPSPAATRRYRQVRAATEALCKPLATDDYSLQSMPDASPAKWHLAHTSWFFEEFVLQPFAPAYRVFDAAFRYLFNSYYEAVGPRLARPGRGMLSRPTIEEVWRYREYVDDEMTALLESGAVPQDALRVITLGLHHEQQHQELLLTDIKHLFSRNPLLPAYAAQDDRTQHTAPALSFHEIPGGLVNIGHSGSGFCFDNELPQHRVHVEPFRLANRAVTNGEWLEFVRDRGYERPELWLAEGWDHVQREGWRAPLYWSDSLQTEFTLCGEQPIDPHAPVCHVSFYEADAFARWAGARLPTEFEWETAANAPSLRGHFVEDGYWHPRAARESSQAEPWLLQMFGDVWEWTRSAYAPYPRYQPLPGALGEYNGKFMVSQLVLRGGSCATPRDHIRASYRNFFYPHARWQFSGVRLAKDA